MIHSGDRTDCSGDAMKALHQCEHLQRMIDISLYSLQALRTKCAASNDLTQQEIRILEEKLTTYICKQLECRHSVPERRRTAVLDSYPRLADWLHTMNLKPQFIEAVPAKLSLDVLLQMSSPEVQDMMRGLGSNPEECSRLTAALFCLKGATETGGDASTAADSRPCEPFPRKDGSTSPSLASPGRRGPASSPLSPPTAPSPAHGRSESVSAVPCTEAAQRPHVHAEDPFVVSPATPPVTPTSTRRAAKPAHVTPPTPRRMLQLFPNFTLARSKSQESQLASRIDDHRAGKQDRMPVSVQINGHVSSSEALTAHSPLLGVHVPSSPHLTLPGPATLLENSQAGSPQSARRDIGLAITHRFSTKSWLSQTCQVCHKTMIFGVKCKHCKLKCHNKCTKEVSSCLISILPYKPRLPSVTVEDSGLMRRAESVPSDINAQIDHSAQLPVQFGTLPKAVTKKMQEPPLMLLHQLDSSSNPSSTTSSTPSSPAPSQPSISPTPPLLNPSPQAPSDGPFPFPDVPISPHSVSVHSDHDSGVIAETPLTQQESEVEEEGPDDEEEEDDDDDDEEEEDAVDELPSTSIRHRAVCRSPISRKASQTSVYLQEWDIPYEQLELGELIGKGRWGKVHKGRWHGEVAIRLLEIDGNNQGHLKLFKKEVMNYRQTRHENVVLFMGACMAPPHLAIITSFCKGRTLFSFVRDAKQTLDINTTRQIAQEIVKGMGYLHAKGIVHKDLKSKNVFYDSNKAVITDFGLFGMSGVVQEGRRKNVLRLPEGWIYYLAPEIVCKMGPENNEDQLPFSRAADVYAFGTIWYELQSREWPITKHPVETKIWLVGSGEGVKRVLSDANLGKEVTEILSSCWSFEGLERPSFTQLTDMLEKLPKLNRRLSHPGHWKSAGYVL